MDRYEINLTITVNAEGFPSASVISEYIESFLRNKSAAGLIGIPIVCVDLEKITFAGGSIGSQVSEKELECENAPNGTHLYEFNGLREDPTCAYCGIT